MPPRKKIVPEDELVAGLVSRSEAVMSALYDQYSAALYGILLRIVKDEAVAQDVLQDAFVKIWRNGANYDSSKGTLFTWMLNVARNTGIDYLRSKQHRAEIQTDSFDVSMSSADYSTYDHTDTIGLREVVARLKPEHQTVLDLLYFKGYTHEQAAELLGLPLGTVKTRVRTAVMVLRGMLKEKDTQ
jgi:RNA polymerase sigma-70 factor (ECF subfamily)